MYEYKLNKGKLCKYYPCHDMEEQDCTFCYCPIYPCEIEETGGKWIEDKYGNKIWDCSDCKIIHEKVVVDEIKRMIKSIIYMRAYVGD